MELGPADINLILEALGKLPHDRVRGLIDRIVAHVQANELEGKGKQSDDTPARQG